MDTGLGELSLPFTLSDMVSVGWDLLTMVGPWVLLGLAFVFVPRIIKVVRSSFGTAGK